MNNKTVDFTIGADPEMGCLNSRGEIIFAHNIIDGGDGNEEFGMDGNGDTFEIRPSPSKDPVEVVSNIHDIFVRQTINKPEFLKYKWISGSYHSGYPFGGHVHFGIGNNLIQHNCAVKILDDYVGVISLLLEVRNDGINRRKNGEYGFMGAMRPQEWGFEYRAMSSWISSPYVAAAIMCLSKTVMYELLNNNNFEWHDFATPDDFYKMDQIRVLSKFPEIWKDITKMYLYQIYKPYIDFIYFLVSNKLTWLPATGMKESWGIINMTPVIKNKICVDVLWHRYNNEV